ncbi:hypothetical protein RDWZM_009176, partial [Blomia tropicalis]
SNERNPSEETKWSNKRETLQTKDKTWPGCNNSNQKPLLSDRTFMPLSPPFWEFAISARSNLK